jgi:tetratricopeptide (TPR) repeat protein
LLASLAAWAQNPPRPKSQAELDALKAIDAAPSLETRLKKIDDFLAAYADSDYKLILLDQAVAMAADKNNYPLAMAWGQRDLDANPHSFVAMEALARVTAANTREFDLDKDQKLNQAEKWANSALEELKTAQRPPLVPEDRWPAGQKYYQAQCHLALGTIAIVRKKYDVASAEFQTAFDITPEPAYLIRLGEAQIKAGNYDAAIATYDKVLATPNLHPVIKGVADREKADAVRRKGGLAPAAPAAQAQPAPAPSAPSGEKPAATAEPAK